MTTEHLSGVLPIDELVQILRSENRQDFVIGGKVLPDRSLLLYRGDLEPVKVPLSWFIPRPGDPEPDPTRFSVANYGQSLHLGEYEVAIDAVLRAFDDAYRSRY